LWLTGPPPITRLFYYSSGVIWLTLKDIENGHIIIYQIPDEQTSMLKVLTDYTSALDVLNRFDHQSWIFPYRIPLLFKEMCL
jgi:hypothetical protein